MEQTSEFPNTNVTWSQLKDMQLYTNKSKWISGINISIVQCRGWSTSWIGWWWSAANQGDSNGRFAKARLWLLQKGEKGEAEAAHPMSYAKMNPVLLKDPQACSPFSLSQSRCKSSDWYGFKLCPFSNMVIDPFRQMVAGREGIEVRESSTCLRTYWVASNSSALASSKSSCPIDSFLGRGCLLRSATRWFGCWGILRYWKLLAEG